MTLFRCTRCLRRYGSIAYRGDNIICLFCANLEADIEERKPFLPDRGIKSPHIVVVIGSRLDRMLRRLRLAQVVRVEERSCAFGVRRWYLCRDASCRFFSQQWFDDWEVRPVRVPESDAAIGWLMGADINRHLEEAFPHALEHTEGQERYDALHPKLSPKELWRFWNKKEKAIDLFAGAGGFSLGLAQAGWSVVGHVEHDTTCIQTYEYNNAGGPFGELIGTDIEDICDYDILDFARRRGPIGLICGGPPCQGFSMAGKRDPKDPRNSLFMHFVRFCRIIQPPAFVLENVPGLRSMKTAKGESALAIIIKSFEDVGYRVAWAIPNCANYGVPQERRRIIMMGNRFGKPIRFMLPMYWDIKEGEGYTTGEWEAKKKQHGEELPLITSGDALDEIGQFDDENETDEVAS